MFLGCSLLSKPDCEPVKTGRVLVSLVSWALLVGAGSVYSGCSMHMGGHSHRLDLVIAELPRAVNLCLN